MNSAILDIETGGFSISKNGVCEIGMVAFNKDFKILEEFHVYIKPYPRIKGTDELVSYKDDAMAVNGLTVEKLINEGVDVDYAMYLLSEFMIRNKITTIVGHNSKAFDIPRVQYLLDVFHENSSQATLTGDLKTLRSVDTMEMAGNTNIRVPNLKLSTLCEHFGIVNTAAHTALGDCYATLEVYKNLTISNS